MTRNVAIYHAQAGDAALLHQLLLRAFREYDGRLDPPSGANNETVESIALRLGEGGAFLYPQSRLSCPLFEVPMLELRPTCEHCNKALPPASLEARICTYECTFCASCVDNVIGNVCPNCGGGFVPRPIRPATNWKGDNFLGKDPASTKVKHRPVDPALHAKFSAAIRAIPPEQR